MAFPKPLYENAKMRFQMQTTADGSSTVFDAEAGECFKSRHAALTETEAVFFQPGIAENPWLGRARPFRVLELGFGLGTNFLQLKNSGLALEFVSIERDLAGARYFLEKEDNPALRELVEQRSFREGAFRADLCLSEFEITLPALRQDGQRFHAIFFDPFSPKANPSAWSPELFALCAELLEPEGRLVTYSVSRVAKTHAEAAGLCVTKRALPAALQKRQSLLAVKQARGPDKSGLN